MKRQWGNLRKFAMPDILPFQSFRKDTASLVGMNGGFVRRRQVDRVIQLPSITYGSETKTSPADYMLNDNNRYNPRFVMKFCLRKQTTSSHYIYWHAQHVTLVNRFRFIGDLLWIPAFSYNFSVLITSNVRPLGCPIICTDIYSQCYCVHWHLWQCLIHSSSQRGAPMSEGAQTYYLA